MIFGQLADRFGWTFEEIGNMTRRQIEAALEYIKEAPPKTPF